LGLTETGVLTDSTSIAGTGELRGTHLL
jgi:hypothetical protein